MTVHLLKESIYENFIQGITERSQQIWYVLPTFRDRFQSRTGMWTLMGISPSQDLSAYGRNRK